MSVHVPQASKSQVISIDLISATTPRPPPPQPGKSQSVFKQMSRYLALKARVAHVAQKLRLEMAISKRERKCSHQGTSATRSY